MTRSPQQEAIVQWGLSALLSNTRKSLVGNACAGSGKTTVAAELIYEALIAHPELAGDIAYLSFGKRNQRDMTSKLNKHGMPPGVVNVQTFNAAGLSQLIYRGRKCAMDWNRSRDILEDLDVPANWRWSLAELWVKMQEAAYDVADERGQIWWPSLLELETLAVTFDVDTKMPVRKKTLDTWRRVDGWMKDLSRAHAKLEGVVTFGDQVWLPVRRSAEQPLKSYRLLIVDEYQDLNTIRRIFANLSVRENTVSLFLGDKNQAIMGFAGADRRAFESVVQSQPAGVDFLPLSWTFRCPPAVVKDAQLEVKEIECAPGLWIKEDGINEIRALHKCNFLPGDVILCRNNRPLVDMFFKLLDKHIPVRFEGSEWSQKMLTLHKAFMRREDPETLTAYRQGVHDEGGRRVKELLDHQPPRKWKAAQVRDEYGAWVALIGYVMHIPQSVLDTALAVPVNPFGPGGDEVHVARGVDTVRRFLEAIEKNANEDSEELRDAMVTLSTGHKAKGLEWNNVYWYGFDQLHPSKLATTEEELEQEKNLVYVIKTRARRALYKIPLKAIADNGGVWGDDVPDDAGVFEDESVGVVNVG